MNEHPVETIVSRLSADDLSYPGVLVITSYITKDGKVAHHCQGVNLTYPPGESEIDLTFIDNVPPSALRDAHRKTVDANKRK